ncbi:Translational activator GCN1 isoform A [Chlorella sorokiniana]|uniref:Translational activator GCN1 isoform A n=1 Tax=Chlorella sorokiniana TaxID=3076 RepID=A0A2P6TNE6_CHLSO|nr:Translational activator GCN1 isoform A [Chlorella sorokiniana]|eukprot:PRW50843.1 Translational activator GCN1 isoform A [Chlorella sorokiniana]
MAQALERVQALGTGAAPTDRAAAWSELAAAAAGDAGFVGGSAAELAQLVVKTLPDYTDSGSQAAVQQLVDAGVKTDAFLKALAGGVVKNEKAKLKPHEARALVGWAAAILRELDIESTKKAVVKLLECQAAFLEALAAEGEEGWAAGEAAVAPLLRRKPELAAEAAALAKAKASGSLARALLASAAGDAERQAALLSDLLPVYCDKVLSAKERGSPAALACWGALAAAASEEQVAATLLPTVVRMTKRNPEPALAAAAPMLAALSLDLSGHVGELWPALLQQSRHAKEAVRALAAESVAAMSSHIGDSGVTGEQLSATCRVLDGSAEGKVKAVAERASLAGVIAALAAAPGRGPSVARVAGQAADFICKYYKEELSEDVKVALAAALAAWLPRCGGMPEPALARIADAFKEKEALRRAHLRALASALRCSPEARAAAAQLAGPLGKLVLEGCSKAAARLDGLLALTAAAYIASADLKADEALGADKVWEAACAADSQLLAPATASKLATEDAGAAAEAAAVLLTQHARHLGGETSPAAVAAARTLALLLLHPAAAPRAAAATAAATVSAASPELAATLVAGLQHWASNPATPEVVAVLGDAAGAAQARFAAAVVAAAPAEGSVQLSAGLVSALLLLAHHPSVAGPAAGSATWAAVARKLGPVADVLASAPADVAAALVSSPTSGAACPEAAQQAAAAGALWSAMAIAAAPLFEAVMAALRPLLDTTAHDALSAREVKIYFTPADKLSFENEDGTIMAEEIFQQQLLSYRPIPAPHQLPDCPEERGPAAADAAPAAPAADGQPAAAAAAGGKPAGGRPAAGRGAGRPAAAGGRGGGAAPKSNAAAEARQKQLAGEAEVRAKVVGVRDGLRRGLAALAAVAGGNRAFTAEQLDVFCPLAFPLLTSPLVGATAAFDACSTLAGCLPVPELSGAALPIACSLRLVLLTQKEGAAADWQHLSGRQCVVDTVTALAAATGGSAPGEEPVPAALRRPLPGPTYMFCFPILLAVMSCPEPTPLHEAALGVVALHVGPAANVSKVESFRLLYHVLEIIPAYRDRVQPLLRMLCASTPADDVEGFTAALQGLVAGQPHVRGAALQALDHSPAVNDGTVPAEDAVLALMWLARCDPSEANAEVAQGLWEEAGCTLPASFAPAVMEHLSSQHADVRMAAAVALAEGSELHPQVVGDALERTVALYNGAGDDEAARAGAAVALQALAPGLSGAQLTAALEFLLSRGLADSNSVIREGMVAAGIAIVDAHGGANPEAMLPLFESYLDKQAGLAGLSESQYDAVRGGAVVFLGTLARHLDPENPKVRSIVGTLLEVLTTPSESVQRGVSDCLPALMQALQSDSGFVESTVQTLLQRCLKGAKYGDRRGAAYGLAGAVKGLGISSLRQLGIMDALKAAIEDKTSADAREGSLLAFECLSDKLGRLFEPYVIQILPMLLVCFGDGNQAVRDAADGAARAIMGQLSGQGVKLVLPALLKGVEDKAWRTKQGSIQLLGAMAYCAPKQLGTCLPIVVPRLGEVLADPHPKVASAAKTALNEVGSVIRNPEVAKLVPVLLAAIADPNANNKQCLDTLLATVFVNTVDAPSLALIIPVVHRGLRDRSGDQKKRAARIVGNLCTLVNDPRDMQPYVPLLLPELKAALVDPLPEVRATAAKALGSLVKDMGEDQLGGVVPWLLEKLRSEASAVERSGAAQGLAEVLAVQGPDQVAQLLPDIIVGCRARNAAIREGHLTLFKYLPLCMPDDFVQHLPQVLACILDGLADEAEGVRDAALAAGRIAVELYATTALPLLLPAVEEAIMSHNWRIRQSSVELLGDLLFKVAGTTGRIQQDLHNEEEEGISAEAHGQAIVEALGQEKRNHVLATVYMARSDVAYTVRTAALHVWKTVVTNTPKTLGELLPQLMAIIIESLADPGEDRRQMAGRCLGELVRKMGDRILSQIIPILREGMASPAATTRQGVCNGLKEVMENATRTQLADHLADLLQPIQGALCDDDAGVRTAAGGVFNVLFKSGGGSAMDSVIPALLSGLDSDAHSAQALEGLRVVLGVRPQLLSVMVPRLIKPPVTSTNLRALGALAEVAGAAIHGHLAALLPPLLALASNHPDVSPQAAAAHQAVAAVALSVQEDGLYLLMQELQRGLEEPARRRGAATVTALFCRTSKLDFQEHVPALITALVPLLAEDEADTLLACWEALGAVTASIPKEMQPSFVRCLKDAVATARDKERRKRRVGQPLLVPGLCLPKALQPVLPIYLQGVLQGSSAELRELAAEGLGELVEVTGEDALKPFVVQITGPLIRIIGDRFPWQIKAAILKTLGLLIGKAGAGLKPFVPQLQTTFVKCLSDPQKEVRQRAALNLGELARMSMRADQLVADLATGARTAEPSIQEAYLTALHGALLSAGERLTPDTISKVGQALQAVTAAAGDDEDLRAAAAAATGAFAKHCSAEELRGVLESGPLATGSGRLSERIGSAQMAAAIAQHAAPRLEEQALLQRFVESIVKAARDPSADVKAAAARATGRLLLAQIEAGSGVAPPSLPPLVSTSLALLGMDQDNTVQRTMLSVLRRVAVACPAALPPHWKELVPSICAIVQSTAGPTKVAAERTLARVLALDKGIEPAVAFVPSGGPLARTILQEAFLRRLSKMPVEEEDDGLL